jgi:hypothetical protein
VRSRFRFRRSAGACLATALAAVTTALAAPPAVAAPASAPAASAVARGSHPVADAQTLASEQARRTGKPVTVSTLTTSTSMTQALPSGGFKLTTSAAPVRAWTRSGWRALDATLRRDSDGGYSPAVAESPVTISGGGSAPLAVMTSAGRSMALYWPGRLPQPTVNGDTAVYHSVLPGVDLRVVVSADGGFRDILVLHNRAAAASPAVRHLALTAVTTGGLRLTGSGGELQAAAKGGAPVFTAAAPLMWDSATTAPRKATPAQSGRQAGTSLSVQAMTSVPAAPAASTADAPGRHAHAAWVRTTITAPWTRSGQTRQTLTLAPDAALLTSASTVYPAYIDPNWYPSGGSRGWYASDNDGFPSSNYYDNTGDPTSDGAYLQVGYDGSFNAHTFVQMKLDASQLKNADIQSSVIQFTEETSWSCTASPVQLWWVGGAPTKNGKPWVSWDDEPSWNSEITSMTVAHGYSGCPAAAIDFNISSFMQSKGPAGPSTMTFGLKAANLGNTSQWKEFSNASGATTMTTYYDHYPNAQADSLVSPGGACQSVSPASTIVGNDDLKLQTTPSDADGGSLKTEFVVTPYGSSTALLDTTLSTSTGVAAPLPISRTTIQGWHSDGTSTAYQYAWYTITTDKYGLSNSGDTGLGSKSQPCLFTYDPTAPQAPGIVVPPVSSTSTDGAIGNLGGTATFTFGNCSTAVDSPPVACSGTAPTTYTYQVNDGFEQTVSVTGTTQSVTIPLSRIGANTISVVGLSAAGNPSAATSASYDVDPPTTPYGDGDYAGTGSPDLITVGDGTGAASEPGLWLAESDGGGHLSTPVDIGARGTGLNTNGTPADWAGTQVLHGDFTGDHVQDIVSYDPGTGDLQMIGGPGTAASLDPESGNTATALGNPLGDPGLDIANTDTPSQVVAAGNASLQSTGLPDLIAALGDTSSGYELNVYTASAGASFATGYDSANIYASTQQSPDGSAWGPNWTLEIAQPGGQPVLFALDKANGQLWESVNATQSATPNSVIGMPGSTWTKVTGGPWSANAGPALVQADVNSAGNIEVWTTSGATATSWTLPPPSATTGDTTIPLTQGAASTLANPGHAWPLTDGPADGTAGSASLVDTESATGDATPSTGLTYTGSGSSDVDPVLGPVAVFNGSGKTSITLPAGILQDNTSSINPALQSMTLTMKFHAQPGATGILAGTSNGHLTDATLSNSSDPIMYIGTDGHLYAQFPSGHVNTGTGTVAQDISPLVSPSPVDDGQWHTVALVADGTNNDQILYLDNNPAIHLVNNGNVDSSLPATIINPGQGTVGQSYGADQVTIGAGIFSDEGWVNSDASTGNRGTTHASYFTGQISDVAFYPQALPQAQLPETTPAAVTSDINSGVSPTICVDNTGGSSTSQGSLTNKNKIQIYTCNGFPSQNWTFQPNGTITIVPGHCLDVTGAGTANGTLIDLYSCNNGGAQQWQILSDGAIMNPESGKCLDDPSGSTTNGTQLQIYTCNGTLPQSWSSLARPTQAAQVGTILSLRSSLCVDNTGGSATSAGSTANGNKIQVYTCNGFPSQQWTFEPNGSIVIAGKCLDNTSGGSTNGNKIQLYTCNGTSSQDWAHQDTGDIYNPATGKCIDGGANTVGLQLQLWTCNQTSDQVWVYSSTYNH